MTTATPELADLRTGADRPAARTATQLPAVRALVAAHAGGIAIDALGLLSSVLYLWNLTASGFANSYS